MSSIPVPDEMTLYSSRGRRDEVDLLAWPVLSEHLLSLLRSGGEELRPEPGEVLWDAGDPYDLYLVLAGRLLLVDRREDRGVWVVEPDDVLWILVVYHVENHRRRRCRRRDLHRHRRHLH